MHRRILLAGFLGLLIIATLLIVVPAFPFGWGLGPKPVHAAPRLDDEIVFGDDLTLHEGEHVDGDLVLMGGNLTMRSGSRIAGSITAFGGQVEINGTVEGEVVAFGGEITLGAHARVQGDVVALGGHVHRAAGAQTGKVIEGAAIARSEFWQNLRLPFPSLGMGPDRWSVAWAIVTNLTGATILALLGMAIVTFWPAQTAQVGRTILVAPLPSLGVGCALYPLTASLIVVVLISICLAPFTPFVGLLLVTASLLGWVALGTLWGRWLVRLVGWRRATPTLVAGVGVFALSIAAAIIGAVPGLGPLVVLVTASMGLGAVALSRFGTTRYGGRSTNRPPAEA